MPLYEYVCEKCELKFEALRPASRMDEPAPCPKGHAVSHRVLSMFSALVSDGYGEAEAPSGMGGCGGGCTNCACGN
jgi:putative FmdB family regulatory protein